MNSAAMNSKFFDACSWPTESIKSDTTCREKQSTKFFIPDPERLAPAVWQCSPRSAAPHRVRKVGASKQYIGRNQQGHRAALPYLSGAEQANFVLAVTFLFGDRIIGFT